ncbi:MAG: MerR family transcriptional regulator [Elioraea sp.]|nr:MerR family transcriptional regulator [Elioraea sp.]
MSGSNEDEMPERRRARKAPTAFRTISEVADELHIPQHVLRFWETKFPQLAPLKRGGGRRYYRPEDVELLRRISDLLYIQGYTIKGVQRLLRDGTAGEGEPAATEREEEASPRPQLPLPGLPQPPVETAVPVVKPVVRVRAEAARASSAGPSAVSVASGGSADRLAALRAALSEAVGELRAVRALLGEAAGRGRARARD